MAANPVGFQVGNNLAQLRKPRYVFDGLMREVQQNPEKLKAALSNVLDQAAAGDLDALDWLTCRLEGKPTQSVALDDDGATIQFQAIRMIVVKPVDNTAIPNVIKDIPHDV